MLNCSTSNERPLTSDKHPTAFLTLFDMMAPQNIFDHIEQTIKRRKLKLSDFQY